MAAYKIIVYFVLRPEKPSAILWAPVVFKVLLSFLSSPQSFILFSKQRQNPPHQWSVHSANKYWQLHPGDSGRRVLNTTCVIKSWSMNCSQSTDILSQHVTVHTAPAYFFSPVLRRLPISYVTTNGKLQEKNIMYRKIRKDMDVVKVNVRNMTPFLIYVFIF